VEWSISPAPVIPRLSASLVRVVLPCDGIVYISIPEFLSGPPSGGLSSSTNGRRQPRVVFVTPMICSCISLFMMQGSSSPSTLGPRCPDTCRHRTRSPTPSTHGLVSNLICFRAISRGVSASDSDRANLNPCCGFSWHVRGCDDYRRTRARLFHLPSRITTRLRHAYGCLNFFHTERFFLSSGIVFLWPFFYGWPVVLSTFPRSRRVQAR